MRLTYAWPTPAHPADQPTAHRVKPRLPQPTMGINHVTLADRLTYQPTRRTW